MAANIKVIICQKELMKKSSIKYCIITSIVYFSPCKAMSITNMHVVDEWPTLAFSFSTFSISISVFDFLPDPVMKGSDDLTLLNKYININYQLKIITIIFT